MKVVLKPNRKNQNPRMILICHLIMKMRAKPILMKMVTTISLKRGKIGMIWRNKLQMTTRKELVKEQKKREVALKRIDVRTLGSSVCSVLKTEVCMFDMSKILYIYTHLP